MKIKKKIKKKSGSKTEILRNLQAQPERLVSYKKNKCNFLLFRALMGYFQGWVRVQKLFQLVICTSAMCESPEDEILKGVEWNNHSGFAGRRSCIEWQAIPVTA